MRLTTSVCAHANGTCVSVCKCECIFVCLWVGVRWAVVVSRAGVEGRALCGRVRVRAPARQATTLTNTHVTYVCACVFLCVGVWVSVWMCVPRGVCVSTVLVRMYVGVCLSLCVCVCFVCACASRARACVCVCVCVRSCAWVCG